MTAEVNGKSWAMLVTNCKEKGDSWVCGALHSRTPDVQLSSPIPMSCIIKSNGNGAVNFRTGVAVSLLSVIPLCIFTCKAGLKSQHFYRAAAGASRLKNGEMKLLCSSPATMIYLSHKIN